jgi:uncharacterized protein YdeI (YjbR/CyaY-like superfamily)
MRFTTVAEIVTLAPIIKAYVNEAIALEASGAKVKFKRIEEYEVPAELQARLNDDLKLEEAFEALTPGRRRGYLFFISQAKQAKTREARVARCVPTILAGKGLDD